MEQLRSFLLLAIGVFTLCHGRTLLFQNTRKDTVWVGTLAKFPNVDPNRGGWAMAAGSSVIVDVAESWSGVIWGRTGCSFDASGRGSCQTGDCDGRLECNGTFSTQLATRIDIVLGETDFYDVTLDYGFNLPVTMTPSQASHGSGGSACEAAGCPADVNARCPPELQLAVKDKVIGCKSPCLAFNTDQYCCRGTYNTQENCKPETWPTNYAKVFKQLCPKAYSYAYDVVTSGFMCANSNYTITFSSATYTRAPYLLCVILLICSMLLPQ